jgi:hypothetical protein
MRTDEHLWPGELEKHGHGNCWVWAVGTTDSPSQLARRFYSEHVRFQPTAFSYGKDGKGKQYAYHTIAFAAAYIDMDAGSLGLPYTLEELQQVTQGKTASSLTLRHRCGRPWCGNPWHYDVATKRENDDEEKCHHFLTKMESIQDYYMFQSRVCELYHGTGEACWTNAYHLLEELDPFRLSFTQPGPEEAAEIAAEVTEEEEAT